KNGFTLVSDKDKKIFLVKIEDTLEKKFNTKDENYLEFSKKINSDNRSTILRSYDQLLSKKYKIELNQKTIDRVKNYFK
ncbi:SurA, partial [Candidatus Pelagibacter sp.]|nr:SurA [Candidatus Pelagibacter sp.]